MSGAVWVSPDVDTIDINILKLMRVCTAFTTIIAIDNWLFSIKKKMVEQKNCDF